VRPASRRVERVYNHRVSRHADRVLVEPAECWGNHRRDHHYIDTHTRYMQCLYSRSARPLPQSVNQLLLHAASMHQVRAVVGHCPLLLSVPLIAFVKIYYN